MSSPSVLNYLSEIDFTTESGFSLPIRLSYQVFGQALGSAPIVLINHALTGNSSVIGEHGWWNSLIGNNKTIDTDCYTVLAFDIPGNGYSGDLAKTDQAQLIDAYEEFTIRDIARIFLEGLKQLEITKLYAVVGGSLGGSIAWELCALAPELTDHLVPVACDWKATDWLIANVRIQKQFLANSKQPLEDARMHAMLFYRSAASFKEKFERSEHPEYELYNIESWLIHHGNKLRSRFSLKSYQLMNHLLATSDICEGKSSFADTVSPIKAHIHLVNIDSDGFYVPEETRETHCRLTQLGKEVSYHEINSIHGHDAFLIEFEQLNRILSPIFSGCNDVRSAA